MSNRKKTYDPDFEKLCLEFEQDPGFLEWICQRVRMKLEMQKEMDNESGSGQI